MTAERQAFPLSHVLGRPTVHSLLLLMELVQVRQHVLGFKALRLLYMLRFLCLTELVIMLRKLLFAELAHVVFSPLFL